MAKATIVEVLNKIQENLGESKTGAGSLSSISGLALLIFNTLNEVLYDVANEYKLQPNEVDISITMVTGQATYTASLSLTDFDKDSFKYNYSQPLSYYTPQKFDREFNTQTNTGIPQIIYYWGGFFRPYPIPAASESGKIMKFRAWRVPALYSIANTTNTSYMPEGYDVTLLANYVTWKILSYKQNAEANTYALKVFGDGKMMEGQLDKFKRTHGSPQILDDNIVVEPMENSGLNGFVQPPISG